MSNALIGDVVPNHNYEGASHRHVLPVHWNASSNGVASPQLSAVTMGQNTSASN